MKTLVLTLVLIGSSAMAQIQPYKGTTKQPNADYREYYMAGGRQVDEATAFMSLLRGEKVDRCVGQEASMGKSGKSASMKNIPKNR